MSTPSPLQPQGAIDGAPKSRVRITVLTILALHIVFVGGLLLQGCDRKGAPTAGGADPSSNTLSSLPPLNSDTNYFTAPPIDGYSSTGAGAGTASPGIGTGGTLGGNPGSNVTPALGTGGAVASGLGTPPGGAYPGAPQDLTSTASHTLPPPTTLPSSSTFGGQTTEHVIKRGDLIRDLAKKYGVTEQAILDANPGVKPRSLKINDKIAIPAPAPSTASTATPDAPTAAGTGETYVVKPGDNLTKIARKYGVTISQLRAANNLRNDRIVAKQQLKIPARSTPRQEPAATPPAI